MNKEKTLTKLSRRSFIRNSVIAASGIALLPSVLSSCADDSPQFTPEGEYGFKLGVASFDPTQNQVVLWTRYTPATNEGANPQIVLDVATDKDFTQVVASQTVTVDTNNDNTVYVDVSNLLANTKYYYRFRNERSQATSIIGETKTLPAPGQATEVKLAVVSCSNFQAGLFNVYGAVAESEADVVVHLGDYIYEYGAGGYGANPITDSLGRQHQPEGEIITLDDYRTRYRQYRGDEQLQRAHQLKPFICVWDDHELTNDAWENGAENHNEGEGSFEARKAAALQVWHEYLPARVTDNAKIYRSFNLGGLANLMMLDTRIVGRDKQLDYSNYFSATGEFDDNKFRADWLNSQRTILGEEQRNWLLTELSSSTTNWQVLGSQVLMGKYFLPAEMLALVARIASGTATDEELFAFNGLVQELATIKGRIQAGDPSVTAQERARVEIVLPYNLDAWDGYPVEREMIYEVAKGKKLVSIAGDTHNAWHSKLTAQPVVTIPKEEVGTEFATASVSSPGLEAIFGGAAQQIAGLEAANVLLMDDLQYLNAADRGYLLTTFTATEARAEWRFIATLATPDTTIVRTHNAVAS